MWQLSADNIPALAAGAALLGGGGGGSTRSAVLLAQRALQESGPLDVVDAAELASDAHATPVGLVGSVTVFEEKPPSGAEVTHAAAAMERYTGCSLDALLPFEAAGVNALLAVIAAAGLRLPLIDADGMGRAFPQLDQTVFTLHELAVSPMVLADDKGSLAILDSVDGTVGERLARSAMVTMGGWAMLLFAPQRAADLAKWAIAGTVRKALQLGEALLRDELRATVSGYGGRTLFRGRVVEVKRGPRGRFAGGSAVLRHLDDRDRLLRLEFQNENMLAVEDGRVRACIPDIIALLEVSRCAPVTSEELRYGLELEVLSLPCAATWRTAGGLRLVGPSAFGYDLSYPDPVI